MFMLYKDYCWVVEGGCPLCVLSGDTWLSAGSEMDLDSIPYKNCVSLKDQCVEIGGEVSSCSWTPLPSPWPHPPLPNMKENLWNVL